MTPTPIHLAVEACQKGTHERLVAKMHSGWLVLAEKQVLPGYCLLLADPVVEHLNELQGAALQAFLADMASAGEAIMKVTEASRMNYEILGNLDQALHCHIIPRTVNESEALRTKPIWSYDFTSAPAFDHGIHGKLARQIMERLSDQSP